MSVPVQRGGAGQNIRCPICISMHLATPRAERGPLSKRGTHIPIRSDTASQLYTLTKQVIHCHTDLGSKHYCGVCGRCCESTKGVCEHWLIKHCGYDQGLAASCNKMLAFSEQACAEDA